MHESHTERPSVLLPRRLVDRVPAARKKEGPSSTSPEQATADLAERIGALPGIDSKCLILADRITATDYFILPGYVMRGTFSDPQLMCHMDSDGILLPQIDQPDRGEIVHKGWASRADDALTLFLPRDSTEMEIAWRIVLSVYHFLTSKPHRPRGKRNIATILPSYSSTAKYWM